MGVLANRVRVNTTTTGTGTITLGSAVAGYQTFTAGGITDGQVVSYVIVDNGNAWEVGEGTYGAGGNTLTRTVTESSNSDAALNLSGGAQVFISARAEDISAWSGGDAVLVNSGSYDDITSSGVYNASTLVSDGPLTQNSILFVGRNVGGSGVSQIAMPLFGGSATEDMYFRRGSGSPLVWTSWRGVTSLGVGQAWQNVTGSRSAGSTSYQNTTGKPIEVAILIDPGGGGNLLQASIDDSTWVTVFDFSSASGSTNSASFVVPPSHYYRLTGTPDAIRSWSELR